MVTFNVEAEERISIVPGGRRTGRHSRVVEAKRKVVQRADLVIMPRIGRKEF